MLLLLVVIAVAIAIAMMTVKVIMIKISKKHNNDNSNDRSSWEFKVCCRNHSQLRDHLSHDACYAGYFGNLTMTTMMRQLLS